MPCPISSDFDFLDAELNLAGLPIAELAELRKSEPVHWVDVPGGTGGFGDKGYWLVTKHADVKEVSKRNDVFGSSPDGAIPVWPQEMTRDAIDLQRAVPAFWAAQSLDDGELHRSQQGRAAYPLYPAEHDTRAD